MHAIQRERAHAHFKKQGIGRALLSSHPAVKWLTGLALPIQTGPNPFAGGPPMVWYEEGEFTLLIVEGLLGFADFAADPNSKAVGYQGYSVEEPIRSHHFLAEALSRVIGSPKGEIAVESYDLPAFLVPMLGKTTPIDGWSEPLRTTKTEEEMVKLRENFRLADLGQAAARKAVKPGATEMDVYLAAYEAIHQEAGQLVPIGNDFVASHRQNNIGGGPAQEKIGQNESCIVDISTILKGYWSDSCETYYAEEPTKEQKAARRAVADALAAGIEMLRPGVRACDVDRKLRDSIAQAGYPIFPHHGGHGVGVTGHEAPRIVPYNQEVLEPGMVVMLEPGTYEPGKSAVRLEHAVLIREDGPEVLTNHIEGVGGRIGVRGDEI